MKNLAASERFGSQLRFIIEVDKVKHIIRKTRLFDGSRYENDAEHSWHIALMAIVLQEYSNVPVDLPKVIVMHLIHDLVEIEAGDTFLYAPERADVFKEERAAADKIFGMLPADQKEYFFGLWLEFEERKTSEAKYAAVLDRLEPLLQNIQNRGGGWKEHHITLDRVLRMNRHVEEGAAAVWEYVQAAVKQVFEEEGLL